MAVTVAAYESALDAAVTAVAASDWTTARNQVVQARIIAAALPKYTQDGATVDYKEQIKDLIEAIDAAEIAAGRSGNRITTTRTSHGRSGRGGRFPCGDGCC